MKVILRGDQHPALKCKKRLRDLSVCGGSLDAVAIPSLQSPQGNRADVLGKHIPVPVSVPVLFPKLHTTICLYLKIAIGNFALILSQKSIL